MNSRKSDILTEYDNERSNYILLADVVSKLLREIVVKSNIQTLTIEHRIKNKDSLSGKLELKGEKYKGLSDITDILGARVVCIFADDVDRFARHIEENFSIDNENSVDKREQLDPNSFGYLSLHYICSLPNDKQYPEAICGKKFEIQLRSALQHTWSAIYHDMGYKSEFDVPKQIVRDYSRLAGLLELADEKFVYIRDYMSNYSIEVKQKIANDQGDYLKIDIVTLREYMYRNKNMLALLKELASICDSEIDFTNPERYIRQLAWLGKSTLGDLRQMLEKNHDVAIHLAKRALEGTELDILSSTVGLRFLCQAELLQENYSEDRVIEFLLLSSGNIKRAQNGAKSLLRHRNLIQGTLEDEIYQKALAYATRKHDGQLRIGGEPYIMHPIAVAQMMRDSGYGVDYQIAALFHDLLEDTDATQTEIEGFSNKNVYEVVLLLTKRKGCIMKDYIDNICNNPMAKVIKAADRLHNLECALGTDPDFKRRYILETVDWYLDFSPEIPKAVRKLAQSLEQPLSELSLSYKPIQKWIKN